MMSLHDDIINISLVWICAMDQQQQNKAKKKICKLDTKLIAKSL